MIHMAPDLLTDMLADLTGAPAAMPLFTAPVITDTALAGAAGLTGRDRARAAGRVRAFLSDGDAAQATLTDLAEVAGSSRFAAYRAFRSRFGLSPSDYQRQLRLRAARRALASGAAVADVAAATGFADQAHLTRWFRRCYGITPGAYRAACG
jgi:AraC-like DNA-binding protein